MGLILDTSALSAVADGDETAAAELRLAGVVLVPVIVLGEFRFGILQSRMQRYYEHWLRGILSTAIVLSITEKTAVHYAQVRLELKRSGTPIPPDDIWIGALCRQHASPILSRDRHFDRIKGLRRIAW